MGGARLLAGYGGADHKNVFCVHVFCFHVRVWLR